MLSKNKAKYIISLQRKKFRDEEGIFVIEGDKIVKEFLGAGIELRNLIAKPEFISGLPETHIKKAGEITEVSYDELKLVSTLKTPHNALALVPISTYSLDISGITSGLCCALDFVQDPGNLGTIIRAAAWFGISNIVCSENCVDVYNPKVIQATMGAILHVKVHYTSLKEFLSSACDMNVRVFGACLDGESIVNHESEAKGIILLGNESKGISAEYEPYISDRIKIPSPVELLPGIESLNVSMAASVLFYEFTRGNTVKTSLKKQA